MTRFHQWLQRKWQPLPSDLMQSYQRTFASADGQRVLQHLIDSVYATTCEQTDGVALATHNGRRSVVQELLHNIDLAEWPDKYKQEVFDGHSDRPVQYDHTTVNGVRDFR